MKLYEQVAAAYQVLARLHLKRFNPDTIEADARAAGISITASKQLGRLSGLLKYINLVNGDNRCILHVCDTCDKPMFASKTVTQSCPLTLGCPGKIRKPKPGK